MKGKFGEPVLFLVLIAGRGQKDALLTALTEYGAQLVHTLYGKGSVKASYLQEMFGLTPEENKVVVTCLLTRTEADAVSRILLEQFQFDKPNTGIAFTIPVETVSF